MNQVGFTTPPSTGAAAWDAIVEVGGSQQFVSEGRYYECHSLKGVEPGSKIAFERVLATKAGEAPTFGEPYVAGARVEATVLENFKDKKLIVFKYRRKKHYKRKNGHRQPMTRFLVTKVVKPQEVWVTSANLRYFLASRREIGGVRRRAGEVRGTIRDCTSSSASLEIVHKGE